MQIGLLAPQRQAGQARSGLLSLFYYIVSFVWVVGMRRLLHCLRVAFRVIDIARRPDYCRCTFWQLLAIAHIVEGGAVSGSDPLLTLVLFDRPRDEGKQSAPLGSTALRNSNP